MPDPFIQTQTTSPAFSTTDPPKRSGKSALAIVFLVVFIDLLGFGIVIPLLPRYGDRYVKALLPSAAEAGSESRAAGAVLGLLMASFSAMQFIFAPIWGRISDRIGRRPILLVGLTGSVLFYLLFGYASDLPETWAALALTLLFVSRIGAGVAGATIATAQAVIADCTTPERRKHGMALIGAAFGIGFTFGPLVGFASLYWFPEHHGAIGYSAAGLSFIALLLGIALLPETRHFEEAPPLRRRWFDWRATRDVLSQPALAPVVLIFFLATLGFGGFEPTLALLIKDVLYLDEQRSFLMFAYVGFVLVMTQGFLYRRLANRLSEVAFMAIGLSLMALGLILLGGVTWIGYEQASQEQLVLSPSIAASSIGLLGSPFGQGPLLATSALASDLVSERVPHGMNTSLLIFMLVSMTLAVVGFAFLTPSAQALVSRRSDPAKQGEILGVNQSAASLARILGPIFGLSLYKLTSSHLLPYLFGAALLLVMLPLLPRIRHAPEMTR